MKSTKFMPVLLTTMSLVACVSKTVQTDALLDGAAEFKPVAQVEGVPFINQEAGHCGPATLAMVSRWAGKPADAAQLAKEIYHPEMKGSLQGDLIAAARRQGLMAVTIEGLRPLLHEIQDGHPVVVFENLALSWLPQWHYAVVTGYDLPRREVVMHSGPEENKRWDLRKFERSWMLADYWGLVVLPPGEVARSAGELANLTAAAGLEQTGQTEAAEKSYARIRQEWPDSLGAMIGAANVAYTRKDFRLAVKILREAVRKHPASAAARHNLKVAEAAAGGGSL